MLDNEAAIPEFQRSRLARAVGVIVTCAAAWCSFGCYYLLTGREISGAHCVLEGLVGFACAARAYCRPDQRLDICRFYVAMIVFGLAIESCLIGLANSLSPMFYCCAVLVATLTLGIRNAAKWIIACVLLLVATNFVLPFFLPDPPQPTPLDRLLAYVTLLGVISSCAFIAESNAEAFARRLEATSQDLRDRTLELDQVAGIDSLTGLKNRRSFNSDSKKLLGEEGQRCALLLIDLNDFKVINDRFGHASGDDVLKNLAKSVEKAAQGLASVYRLGGDEFVALIPGDDEPNLATTARLVAERIVQAGGTLGQDKGAHIGISIGVAVYPDHASSIDELVSFADKAMYEAKAGLEPVVVFESRMAREVEEKRLLVQSIDRAIEQQDFLLYYQPQVAFDSNTIVGLEALVRWNRGGEVVGPNVFIPILESNGKIVQVGEWVLREACRQTSEWHKAGFDGHVAVNVTSLQIQQPTFSATVLRILGEYDLPGEALYLEVTESLLLKQGQNEQRNIEELTSFGVQFSIDDFGTGYSSLSYLKQLTVDELKIDRSFIKDIPDSDDGVLAATIITLAKQLDKTVVAEGVETEVQRAFLESRGCNSYQGYLFSKPLPADKCTRLLLRQGKHRSACSHR